MVLLDKVIANKPVRVLYYRISAWTKQFERFAFLKNCFIRGILFFRSNCALKRKIVFFFLIPAFAGNWI